MDSRTGELYGPDLAEAELTALRNLNPDIVEVTGSEESIQRLSAAVKAAHKKARKAQKKARRANRTKS